MKSSNVKVVLAALGVVVVIAAVTLGMWQAGWWFKTQNTNRDAHVTRSSYGFQQTLRDQITKGIGDVTDVDHQITQAQGRHDTNDVTTLTAQRRAVANQVCQEAEQVTGDPLPADQANWVQEECEMGTAK